MRETTATWISLRWYWGAAIALVTVLSVSFATMVSADDVKDTTPPVVKLNIADGNVRNTEKITLTIDDEHRHTAFIEVVKADGSSFDPRVMTQSDQAGDTLMLRWNTHDVSDGAYMIKYGATDMADNMADGVTKVVVDNKTPFVTMNPTADQRTIGGSLSLPDSTFQIKLDGTVSSLTPKVADAPDDEGNYIWTLAIPDTIADGAHSFEIVATRTIPPPEGDTHTPPETVTSTPVTQSVTLTTPPVVPKEDPIPVGMPTLDLADQIGQFVAPALPIAPATPVTQLYGVTTTDLTNDTAAASDAAITPVTQSLKRTDTPPSATSVATAEHGVLKPSESGWVILGLAWYWWLAGAMVAVAISFGVMRTTRQREQVTRFVRVVDSI